MFLLRSIIFEIINFKCIKIFFRLLTIILKKYYFFVHCRINAFPENNSKVLDKIKSTLRTFLHLRE